MMWGGFIIGFARTFAFLSVVALVSVRLAFAQGPTGGQSQGTQPIQLPLSGRPAQNGSVRSTESPVPGTTTSVNTVNATVEVQGPFTGSTRGFANQPFSGKLSFREAIERGLAYNLGEVGLVQAANQAHGQARVSRSALLPNLVGDLAETVQQTNLRAEGVRFNTPIPGFSIPTVVGPFNYFDLRARLSQSVIDLTAWNNYKSAKENVRAAQLSARDARDLVVLAVGGTYLQVIAAKARARSARAQFETANALYDQAAQQRKAGVLAQVDADRSQVQALTQQQRLFSLDNDLAKQKIDLARMTGLRPNDQYEITDDIPFSPTVVGSVDEVLEQSLAQRSDLKASEAQVRSAERAVGAARAQRLPSLSVNGDYGVIGTNPSQSHGTFSVSGTLRFSLWEGGRIEGNIEQERAALTQRQAEFEDLKLQVESEIRKAFLDMQAATNQVAVAEKNLEVAKETLDLTRQKVEAGVAESVELVQSQEALATAELDYINSVFAHNLAKLTLARSTGRAVEVLPKFLNLP
jgi:outer membrane protein TolC